MRKWWRANAPPYLDYPGFDLPKLEVVRIPFEGKEIVGYLRLTDDPRTAPLMIGPEPDDTGHRDAPGAKDSYPGRGALTLNCKENSMGLQHGTGIRRVVTGHTADGAAIVAIEDWHSTAAISRGDAEFALIWTTPTVPADNNDDTDGATRDAGMTLHSGSVIRVVDIGPSEVSPMHRSNSIDYGILLSGELELELEGGTVARMAPGDIVVQRGTNHLWRNPSRLDWCRIAFILIEAKAVQVDGRDLPEIHP